MTSTPLTVSSRARLLTTAAVAVHLVIAIALFVVALNRASIVLPVSLTVPAGGPGAFATVDLAAASAVVLLVSVVARLLSLVLESRGVSVERLRDLRMLELSQIAGITVFIVALLNGITEAGTLIVLYAVAAASVGVLWVQGRAEADLRAAAWPYSLAAALAIVPWGVVALYQVVGIVISAPPAPIVRVLTIVILLLAAAMWLVERRWQLSVQSDARTDALHTVLTIANGLALLGLVVGLARPSALF